MDEKKEYREKAKAEGLRIKEMLSVRSSSRTVALFQKPFDSSARMWLTRNDPIEPNRAFPNHVFIEHQKYMRLLSGGMAGFSWRTTDRGGLG